MSRKRSEAELYRARSGFREGDPIGRPYSFTGGNDRLCVGALLFFRRAQLV